MNIEFSKIGDGHYLVGTQSIARGDGSSAIEYWLIPVVEHGVADNKQELDSLLSVYSEELDSKSL